MTTTRSVPELIAALRRDDLVVELRGEPSEVTGITTDSRAVVSGSLFVAVRGSDQDGHRFAAAAVTAGAAAVVVEAPQPGVQVPQIIVHDGRRAAIALARAWHGDPARRLSLIGVTGTSGKTTTTLLISHLLNRRHTTGSIGTLGAFDGVGGAVPSTAGSLTTPGPVDLQATLAALADAGVDRIAMEASSHSLDQGRLDGLVFDAAAFTNLSHEHLDYHPSMAAYRLAKLKLLDQLAPTGVAAINLDDDAWRDLDGRRGVVTFGLTPAAQVRAEEVALLPASSRFRLAGRFGAAEVSLPLPGDFNVANALAAAATGLGLGLDLATVVERLGSAPQVPGRMERLVERPCLVIRDYAHKPDALERVLRSLRPITRGRLVAVFGCGGDRDRGKRPIMGRIASELADLVVVTSDNPRTEDPETIMLEIAAGIPPSRAPRMISDRREAIRWAIEQAGADDTILLAGKGHETYQIVGREHLPFDERVIVTDIVAGR